MRLLIFIHSLHAGGAERVTANLANHWAGRGWQVTVATLTSEERDFYTLHPAVRRVALDVAGVSASALAAVGGNVQRIRAVRRMLKDVRPDVALAMMSTANILLALAAWGLKPLVAVGSERIHPPRLPLGRAWETLRRHAYGRLDAVVALTEESANWLSAHTAAQRRPVIPNAVSWPLPLQAPRVPVPSLGAEQRLLLAVGRLTQQKGFDLLITAFARVAADFPAWRLAILGDGSDRVALEVRIAACGLSDRVLLPGRAGNVGEWYAAADLYVMSSRFEGFPNTLVEAMAHGLPTISFDCDTGPRDIIRHETDGLLVSPEDVAGLTTALAELMGDDARRQKFCARALDVRERFSMERIAGVWESLFQELRHVH